MTALVQAEEAGDTLTEDEIIAIVGLLLIAGYETTSVTIPRGGIVVAVLGSANHDEAQFPDPETLNITREPNKHLAFGLGTHFCLGAPLARLEGEIALTTLFRRFPNLRLTQPPESLRWRRGASRGPEQLPVALK